MFIFLSFSGSTDGRPNAGGLAGAVGRSSSSQPQHFKQPPKRSFPPIDSSTKQQQQAPFNILPRFPSAIAGPALAAAPSVPVGAFKHPSAAAPAPGGVATGGSGVGGFSPRRYPPPHFNSKTTSAEAPGRAAAHGFRSQLNEQLGGKKAPVSPTPNHSSSLIKGIPSSGVQSPMKAANDEGVLHGGNVTPAPLQHVAGGGSGLHKALPLLPPMQAPSDSSGHTVRANPTLFGGITAIQRPDFENNSAMPPMAVTAPSMGPQMSSAVEKPGNEYTTREGVNECHHQESVRLSIDGPRIVLTPLYKSLVQQNFFHLVTRDNAETLLKG